MRQLIRQWLIAAFIIVALFMLSFPIAFAHKAPSGWDYDLDCCDKWDCRPAKKGEVREKNQGYERTTTGDWFHQNSTSVRQSKDGLYHVCDCQGCDDRKTRCIYVPPKGF